MPVQRSRRGTAGALRTLVVGTQLWLCAGSEGVQIPGFNAHIPPPPATSTASRSPGSPGAGVCTDGVWKEASITALESGTELPSLQCWRKPPCARWSYATPERCKLMPNDEDWPTADPYLPSNPSGQHTMKELLDTHWKDKTVIFVGDSINSLVYHAAVCEAAKVYDVAPGGHGINSKDTSALSIHTRMAEFLKKLNDLNQKHFQSGGTLWLPRPPQLPTAVAGSRTMFALKGWHMWKESDMQATMELADVIIVNYGLHYQGNVTEHDEMMPLMFKQLEEFAARPGKAAFFRETGSEHKNVDEKSAEGGFLESEVGHPDASKVRGCQCRQRKASDEPEFAIRLNNYIHGVAAKHPRVALLPFYNMTQPRFDLHEAGFCAFEGLRGKKPTDPPPYCCDCTHYCYTPQLWKAFFHNVFEAHEAAAKASS